MPPDTTTTIQLDRPRAIRWTNRAAARNSSLPRPVLFSQMHNPRRRFYVLLALVWCALVDKDHPFEAPEDLAEYLHTDNQQVEALKAVNRMITDAFPDDKRPTVADSSATGPVPSQKGESASQPSTGGN